MISKISFVIIISLSVVWLNYFFITPIFADFNQDYQGFLQTYDAYRNAHNRYITTRSQYLQYQTLNAQNDALQGVKEFLTLRNQILLSYISLLRLKNVSDPYVNLLNNEENLIKVHNEKINAVSTLNDAVTISKEVEKRHLPFQITSKKIIATIILSKVSSLRSEIELLESEISLIITDLKNLGYDVTTLERWFLDAKNKLLLADQKISLVQNQINGLTATDLNSLGSNYNKIQFASFEAHQYLKETLAFLTELSESIKYGNY